MICSVCNKNTAIVFLNKIENGKMMKITASGLKPVIIIQNIIKIVAIELREAKNPLVVEKSPINAKANDGSEISGARNTPSRLLCHENARVSPNPILFQNSLGWKFGEVSNSANVEG